MSALARHCFRHPDRAAIGVCVVTRRAICEECSTRHQGVNYSKEGLAQFLAEQRQAEGKSGRGVGAWVLLGLLSAPSAYLMWLGLAMFGEALVDLLQMSVPGAGY